MGIITHRPDNSKFAAGWLSCGSSDSGHVIRASGRDSSEQWWIFLKNILVLVTKSLQIRCLAIQKIDNICLWTLFWSTVQCDIIKNPRPASEVTYEVTSEVTYDVTWRARRWRPGAAGWQAWTAWTAWAPARTWCSGSRRSPHSLKYSLCSLHKHTLISSEYSRQSF